MIVWGIDVGVTSIGWAVVDIDEANFAGRIVKLGVRIFPEARDPKHIPLNQERRAKRMMRRQIRRRRQRRRLINESLAEAGLLPSFQSPQWQEAMRRPDLDPYLARAKGLDERLEPWALGRAIYHLSKRRHFKGREVEEDGKQQEDSPDDEKAKGVREQLLSALNAESKTLGQWLSEKGPHEKRRGHHATRDVVADEFWKLVEVQKEYHPVLNDAGFIAQLEDAIFRQRPVFWRLNTLGECRLMPGEPLCPKGSWLSQQRRMLEKVNNLRIAGGNERPLDEEERNAILSVLETQQTISWTGVRRALEPIYKARGTSARSLKFNLELGGERDIKGNRVEQLLRMTLSNRWDLYPHKMELRSSIFDLLFEADYARIGNQRIAIRSQEDRFAARTQIAERLRKDFDLAPEEAERLSKAELPAGWEPYSTAALKEILAELERGTPMGKLLSSTDPEWDEWRHIHFPNRVRPTGELVDRLPSPKDRDEQFRLSKLRNPTVVRTLNELRKVTNNLIGVYGKPDLIRIELARSLSQSKAEREEMTKGLRNQEKRRRDAAKDLQENGISEPSKDDIEKWLLWQEASKQCPYTGDHIGFDDLFRSGLYQVEHIWPRKLSPVHANRIGNKTLCKAEVNREKNNRSPWQAFGHQVELWTEITARLTELGKSGMPRGKVRRFLAREIPDSEADGFADRQLADTGWAARAARESLWRLWPDDEVRQQKVETCNGMIVANLRRRWGLNDILGPDGEKTRADHRHHAIDALAVACTNRSYIKRLADYYAAKDQGRKPELRKPWQSIRQDAEKMLSSIIISHRTRRKVSGALHKELPYGATDETIEQGNKTYRIYVRRIPVTKLTLAKKARGKGTHVEDIVDPHIRAQLAAMLVETGGDAERAFTPYPTLGPNGPEVRKVRVKSRRQDQLMLPLRKHSDDDSDGGEIVRPFGYADASDSNHHVAIYRAASGTIEFEVVNLLEASRRIGRREPVVRRDKSDGSTFIMSLAPGDSILVKDGEWPGVWIVQGVWSGGQVVLCQDKDADGATKRQPAIATVAKVGTKIAVDPIGRIRAARD